MMSKRAPQALISTNTSEVLNNTATRWLTASQLQQSLLKRSALHCTNQRSAEIARNT